MTNILPLITIINVNYYYYQKVIKKQTKKQTEQKVMS